MGTNIQLIVESLVPTLLHSRTIESKQKHYVSETSKLEFNLGSNATHLELYHYSDSIVTVKSISFFGIEDQQFLHLTKYRDIKTKTHTNGNNHIATGGIWRLEFTIPIFTWIHKVQDLGWLYD